MTIDVVKESSDILIEYSNIPISFSVESILRIESIKGGLGGFELSEERVQEVWTKEYDDHEDERPESWPQKWDVSQ